MKTDFFSCFSLNIFIALIKHGVGPQVFPTLVTALLFRVV